MIAEQIRKGLAAELILCRSRRDVTRLFKDAEEEFRRRQVPPVRKRQVLEDLKRNLELLIERKEAPKHQELVFEARYIIDKMMPRG